MAATPCVVGSDVANAPRAIALRPPGERWAVANADTGIAALVASTRGEGSMSDRPPQIRRAAFAHLRLPSRLPGLIELRITPTNASS
jgi:hypothetical protein